MKGFLSALIASFCMQTALLAGYCNYPAAAALLWIVAAVVLFQSVKSAGGGVRRRTRRRMRDAIATIMLVGGVLRFFILQLPFGGGAHSGPPTKPLANARAQDGSASYDNSGDHTGIILLPEP